MNSRDALKDQIVKKAVVHGKVILSSGKEADYYVDLRRVTLDHEAAPLVGEVMLELTKDLDYEAVGGLTLGADPPATTHRRPWTVSGYTLTISLVSSDETITFEVQSCIRLLRVCLAALRPESPS